ncbi:MAG: hypothetical protein ACI9R3_001369 [Verrucomicrobiales bacterium]
MKETLSPFAVAAFLLPQPMIAWSMMKNRQVARPAYDTANCPISGNWVAFQCWNNKHGCVDEKEIRYL